MSRLSLFIAASCGALLLTMTSCHVGRYFWRNVADINDYRIFPADTIAAAASARHFAQSASPADDPPKAGLNTSLDLIRLLELTRSTAFLVLENDTLRMQWYGEGFDSTSILPSFSIAKSVLSVSIAMAVAEGSLPSIETRVQRYLPEGMDTSLGKLSFRHLLDMRAGLNFKERYHTPFSPMAKFYYGRRLHRYMRNLRVIREPGHEYEYQGAASQIAGIALEQAIGRSYCEFLSERLFEPAGMSDMASWSQDRPGGDLKYFCCLNTTAMNYLRFGAFLLDSANHNGFVPLKYTNSICRTNSEAVDSQGYPYVLGWRVTPGGGIFAKGILGQYVYIHPEKEMVIVRLGKSSKQKDWGRLFDSLAAEKL